MSSASNNFLISSQDLKMLQAVLESVGFNHRTEDRDKKLHNRAARKVIELYLEGLTDPTKLTTEMRFLFGVQKHDHGTPWKPLPRYAIQGLPLLYRH
ncbi:hypothetical protein [Rhizobium nepotum]|jgi:hypothetical protein|uniref:Uncharacterized protein n=2 Tax=Rhizobium nepotum TaxID=1035271 RepID=A0ABR5CSH7_9HYPH|nr:hypothetical protein [Rhizobium nepotum]KJF67735.1 hypothetical protein RS75_11645 [Rhizobium nepotum 39/7]